MVYDDCPVDYSSSFQVSNSPGGLVNLTALPISLALIPARSA